MAGITVIIKKSGLINKRSNISRILNSLNYLNNYSSNILLLEDNVFIGWNKYNEYPIKSFEIGSFLFAIEGKIYNKSEALLPKELFELVSNFSEYKIKEWLLNVDGDFIIYGYDKKSKTLYVLNDILGRLPVYYRKNDEGIIISRYMKFISGFDENISFDKIGMGEYLLFGYLLGERTLFKNIQQLRPSTFILANNSKISFKIINNFNFENKQNRGKNQKEMVSDLNYLFSQACLNRLNNDKINLLALTGGMDSRIIASCLAKNQIPFKTTTMIFKNGAEKEEAYVAKEISKIFNAEWKPIDIYPPNGKDLYDLLKLKEGMSYLATAFLIPFYNQVLGMYGNKINLITGDKGDKTTLSFDNPIARCSGLDDLIKFILDEHSMVSIDDVCSLVDVKKDDILNDLFNLLNSYPENELSQKYSHYRGIEKSHKLAFQGEDRHRRYFWTYEPITSSPFVIYFFNCTDESKKMHRLFTPLLESFSPKAASILYTNFKAPINSFRAKLFMAAVYYLYPKINNKFRSDIKRIFFGGNPLINKDSIFFKSIEEQLNNTSIIKDYFKITNADQLKKYRHIMLQSIFTLTSLIDDTYADDSILKTHFEDIFDHMI